MIESLINGSNMEKGIVVTIFGMLGVFIVLILFYLMIRLLIKLLPYKKEEEEE
ncbi:MAG: OadG family protein [Clostridiaceae bacterium]